MNDTKAPSVEGGKRIEFDIPVRWGDLDAMNHVNNTVYFRYVEEARVQLMRQIGLGLPAPRSGVLAHAALDFIEPILYPATVRIVHELLRIGRSSLEVQVSLCDAADAGRVYAKGRNVLVAIGADGRSEPWDDEELQRMRALFLNDAAQHSAQKS